MNDLELIAALVAGLYVFESLRVVRADALLLSSRGTRSFRVHDLRGRGFMLQAGRGIVPTGLSPLGSFVAAEAWPLTLTPDGVEGRAPHPIAPAIPEQMACWSLTWSELARFEADGCSLRLVGREREERRVRYSSSGAARWWGERLGVIAAAPPDQRPALIRACYAETLDVDRIGGRHVQVVQRTARLRLVGTGLLLYLLIFVPLTQILALEIGMTGVALGYLALALWGMGEIHLAHGRVLPGRRTDRWLATLLLPIYPAGAMRAAAGLHAEALGHFHPLALAIVLAEPTDRDELARRVAAGLRYFPATPGPTADLLIEFAASHAIDLRADPPAPAPSCVPSRTYCPYCLLQYTQSEGYCPDCVTVPLRSGVTS